MISDLLKNKNTREKSDIKSTEICKIDFKGEHILEAENLKIEIVEVKKIDGGVSVLARAWKNGKQIGFGEDGSVDIERFRIFNPPIMVPDGTKRTVVRPIGSASVGQTQTVELDNFKEDPKQAILLSLAHNIGIVGKTGSHIQIGKIGNTTSTFYPDANVESTSVDGTGSRDIGNPGVVFATFRAAAATGVSDSDANLLLYIQTSENNDNKYINWQRGIALFDTSSIPDTDTISSATLSLYGTAKANPQGWADNAFGPCIVSATTASNTSLATGDFDIGDFGTTEFTASRIGYTNWSTSAYNDMTLDSDGIGHISKTGVTKFGIIPGWDFDNTDPGDGSGGVNAGHYIQSYSADQAGTTNDPKLVVTHAGVATASPLHTLLTLGVG